MNCGESPLPVPPGLHGDCSAGVVDALDRRDEHMLRALIARGAVVNCNTTAARLYDAIRDDRAEALALLLRAGVNPNRAPGEFPDNGYSIWLALDQRLSRGRELSVTWLLLEHRVSPNPRGHYVSNPRVRYADDSGFPLHGV